MENRIGPFVRQIFFLRKLQQGLQSIFYFFLWDEREKILVFLG